MSRYRPYSPDQAYLLPPSVKDELGEGHLCFFIQELVSGLDLSRFREAYGSEGGLLYAPEMMLGLWLYSYATGLTSARELERRTLEHLPLRYLAGGLHPDHWSLSAFRRRHPRALNDVFTQVLEYVRQQGLGKMGIVAIDSTPVKASNGKGRVDTVESLRQRRAGIRRHIRRWQQQCDAEQHAVVEGLAGEQIARLREQLQQIPRRLQALKKSGLKHLPQTDPECRVLHKRGKSVIGYTADIAVSEDQFILAQRVTQASTDNGSLQPMVEAVQNECGAAPEKVVADSGLYSKDNLEAMEKQQIDAYIPDSNLAAALNKGVRVKGRVKAAAAKRMRSKLRAAAGKKIYAQRKAIVEGVFGVMKTERDMHRFRLRGLEKAGIEWTLSSIAFNLTRLQAEQDPRSELWKRRKRRQPKQNSRCTGK
jgi:transposase